MRPQLIRRRIGPMSSAALDDVPPAAEVWRIGEEPVSANPIAHENSLRPLATEMPSIPRVISTVSMDPRCLICLDVAAQRSDELDLNSDREPQDG